MNAEIIIKILKTIMGKDTDPAEVNKPIYLKRRYWALAIFIGSALAYKYYGLVLGNDMQEVILNNLEVVYNSISALVSAAGVLYSVYLGLRGEMGKVKKLETQVAINKLVEHEKQVFNKEQEKGNAPIPATPPPTDLPESPNE